MVRHSNKAAIAYRDELPALKKFLKELQKEMKQLQKKIEETSEQISIGEEVTEIYDGIAIHRYSDTFEAVSGTERGGSYYQAHHRGWYGVITWTKNCGRGEEKTLCNPGVTTAKEAEEMIKIWIVKGIRPTRKS